MITNFKKSQTEIQNHEMKLMESREKLLQAISDADDITFIRLFGNIGDDLIYAGARKLLSGITYRELSVFHLQAVTGDTAILTGGGGWCGPFNELPEILPLIEKRFKHVIVFPSSFDISIPKVRAAIESSKAMFFAREEVSYNMIKNICNADLAHDTAFFFDYSSYKRNGAGHLNAYRTDKEATASFIPQDNDDISLTCGSLDEWLWKISGFEQMNTDRAHVMIAGALLGKKVMYRGSNYHKVPAIAEFSLKDFPVIRKEVSTIPVKYQEQKSSSLNIPELENIKEPFNESKQIRRSIFEIMNTASPMDRFILVDEEQMRYGLGKESTAIPFLEKDGQYWGPPQDDDMAISEFERLQKTGAHFLIITRAAFWWLDYYKEWHNYLRSNFQIRLENERMVVFDLRV